MSGITPGESGSRQGGDGAAATDAKAATAAVTPRGEADETAERAAPRDGTGAVAARSAPRGEADAVAERYARRGDADGRYRLTDLAALLAMQERQRALVDLLRRRGWADPSSLRVLEVGSGGGGNLLELLQLGFAAERLAGIELLPDRHEAARRRLPAAVRLACADATTIDDAAVAPADIVYASTVFSSLLDDAYQQRLAERMWRWTRPGGGVLVYDFVVGNPRNPDVRGVPVARLCALFPHAPLRVRRLTLAPPVARAACRIGRPLHAALAALPFLRTHALTWIGKGRG